MVTFWPDVRSSGGWAPPSVLPQAPRAACLLGSQRVPGSDAFPQGCVEPWGTQTSLGAPQGEDWCGKGSGAPDFNPSPFFDCAGSLLQWMGWLFVAVYRLSRVAASRGYSLASCSAWASCCGGWSMGSRVRGTQWSRRIGLVAL